MTTYPCRFDGQGRRVAAAVALGLLLSFHAGHAEAAPAIRTAEPDYVVIRLQDELEHARRLLNEERLIRTERAMREHLTATEAQGAAMAWSLNDAGLLMAMEGRLEIAKPLFERALSRIETKLGLAHPARGTLLQNLGDVLLLLRDPAAVERYREAATVFQAAAGDSHPRLASVLNGWATALGGLGRTAEAEELYRRAIRIYEAHEQAPQRGVVALRGVKPPGGYALDVVAPLHNLALLLLDGGRIQEAETLLAQAYKILKKNGLHKSSPAVPVLRALAKVQRAAGELGRADSCDYIATRLELKQANPAAGDSP